MFQAFRANVLAVKSLGWSPASLFCIGEHRRSAYKLSDPTHSIVVIKVKFFQTELLVEICSESLVRAIGKVLLVEFS